MFTAADSSSADRCVAASPCPDVLTILTAPLARSTQHCSSPLSVPLTTGSSSVAAMAAPVTVTTRGVPSYLTQWAVADASSKKLIVGKVARPWTTCSRSKARAGLR